MSHAFEGQDSLIPGFNPVYMSHMLNAHPFFSAYLLNNSMKITTVKEDTGDGEVPSLRAYTNCVDEIGINTDWLNACPGKEFSTFVFAHELLHIIHKHNTTRKGRNPNIWNIACDYYINLELFEMGMFRPEWCTTATFNTTVGHIADTLKKTKAKDTEKPVDMYSCLFDNTVINLDMTVVEIYDKLISDVENQGATFPQMYEMQGEGGGGGGEGGGEGEGEEEEGDALGELLKDMIGSGDIKPYKGDMTPEDIDAQVADMVERAINNSKAVGKEPLGMERIVGAYKKQKDRFDRVLKKILMNKVRSVKNSQKHSYARVNAKSPVFSRIVGRQIILPVRAKQKLGEAVIVVDTSGSVSDDDLALAADTVEQVHNTGKFHQCHVLYCDTEVSRVETFNKGQKIVLNPKGGGGTDFRPAFKYVNEHIPMTSVVIYVTDGYGAFPRAKDAVGYKTIWCVHSSSRIGQVPFGTLLEIG